MLGVIKAMLQALSIKSCKIVSSARQALDLLKLSNKKFHVIFIDLNMPEMDGIELINELNNVNFPGGVVILSQLDQKIIDLAAITTKNNRVHLIGCMNKPITSEKIIAILKKLETIHPTLDTNNNQLSLEELEQALDKNWLVPYYQPIVNNISQTVFALEVLARILRPGEVNAISPGRFIDVAEDQGKIEQVTFIILEQALNDFHLIKKEFGEQCKLAINISPITLNNAKLPELLHDIILKKGFTCHDIIFEITENVAIDQNIQLVTINRLRIKGFQLGLDDYGTGFTNIQQLKSLPYTEIKIDRSLIYNIHNDRLSQVIAKSLFDVFLELNANVVAEGIETEADLNYINQQKSTYKFARIYHL